MQLTKRDIEIIKFVNDFGYCEIPQIMKRFALKKSWMYQIMKRLVEAGFMQHRYILHSQHGVYFALSKGAKLTNLPPIKRVSLGQYEHQKCILNVYMKLREQYPNAYWMSERRLKHDKFFDGIGKVGHIADGLLLFPDDKKISIEVELSIKGKNRIEEILKGYGAQLEIDEVWYYCSSPVMSVLTPLAVTMPFIKIHNLEEFLNE